MVVLDRAEDFQIGRVISRTFGALTQNIVTFLGLAAMLMLPVLVAQIYFSRIMATVTQFSAPGTAQSPAVAMAAFSQSITTSFWSFLIIIVFTFILQAALVQGTVKYLNGDRPNLSDCLSAGIRSFLPLVGLALLAYLGVMLGFFLLVVPGIIIGLMWSVVVPVFVVERPGVFASFGRSRALTKGSRWKIFWLVIFYMGVAVILGLASALLTGASLVRPGAANFAPAYVLLNWIVSIPLSALAAVGVAAIYYELRLVKEGVGPQQLAQAFD